MSTLSLSPFKGIDHVTTGTNGPEWSADAVNVIFGRSGWVARRDGLTQLGAAQATSVYATPLRTHLLGVVNRQLCEFPESAAYAATVLGSVNDDELWFTDVNDTVVCSGLNTLRVLSGSSLRPIGVEVPPAPVAQADSSGGLPEGRYGLVYTYLSNTGEESAASSLTLVDVPANGGIFVLAPPVPIEATVAKVRIYATLANGDVLYRVAERPVASAAGLIGADAVPGAACSTRFRARMPSGRYVRYWHGRLMVARGRTLYFSDAMNYGLYDPRSGFVQLPTRVTFIEPVEGGVFVGQTDGVVFLAGDGPEKWSMVRTGAAVPFPGSSTVISGGDLSADWADAAVRYAVWMSERGYAFGQPNGTVIEPQKTRISVPVGQQSATVVHARKLITLAN